MDQDDHNNRLTPVQPPPGFVPRGWMAGEAVIDHLGRVLRLNREECCRRLDEAVTQGFIRYDRRAIIKASEVMMAMVADEILRRRLPHRIFSIKRRARCPQARRYARAEGK